MARSLRQATPSPLQSDEVEDQAVVLHQHGCFNGTLPLAEGKTSASEWQYTCTLAEMITRTMFSISNRIKKHNRFMIF
jgi:hypothetical protein